MALSGDGKTCVSGSGDTTLKLWDLGTGKLLRTLEGHQGAVNAVALSGDGKTCVSGSWDKTLKLWDVASGDRLASYTGDSQFRGVGITPDGRYAVAGDALGRLHKLEIRR